MLKNALNTYIRTVSCLTSTKLHLFALCSPDIPEIGSKTFFMYSKFRSRKQEQTVQDKCTASSCSLDKINFVQGKIEILLIKVCFVPDKKFTFP